MGGDYSPFLTLNNVFIEIYLSAIYLTTCMKLLSAIFVCLIAVFLFGTAIVQVMSLNGNVLIASEGTPSNCDAGGFNKVNSVNNTVNSVQFTTTPLIP